MSHFQAPQTHHKQLCFHVDNMCHHTRRISAWAENISKSIYECLQLLLGDNTYYYNLLQIVNLLSNALTHHSNQREYN